MKSMENLISEWEQCHTIKKCAARYDIGDSDIEKSTRHYRGTEEDIWMEEYLDRINQKNKKKCSCCGAIYTFALFNKSSFCSYCANLSVKMRNRAKFFNTEQDFKMYIDFNQQYPYLSIDEMKKFYNLIKDTPLPRRESALKIIKREEAKTNSKSRVHKKPTLEEKSIVVNKHKPDCVKMEIFHKDSGSALATITAEHRDTILNKEIIVKEISLPYVMITTFNGNDKLILNTLLSMMMLVQSRSTFDNIIISKNCTMRGMGNVIGNKNFLKLLMKRTEVMDYFHYHIAGFDLNIDTYFNYTDDGDYKIRDEVMYKLFVQVVMNPDSPWKQAVTYVEKS